MAKKQQDLQQEQQESQAQQAPEVDNTPELPLKNYVKKNYRSVMYNDCVIRLKAGQELNDPFLFETLKAQGIEFVNNLADCEFD